MLTKILLTLTALVALLMMMIPERKTQAARFPIPSPLLVDPAQQLQAQVTRSIELSNPRISVGRKTLFKGLLPYIAEQRFDDPEHRRYWVAMIGVESGYDSSAKSPTGAVGLGQLIPRYRNDFGAGCGVTGLDEADIHDDYVNLTLSACYFRKLIEANAGNIPLAMVAYNQGSASKAYKDAARGGSPNAEAAAYVARIAIKKAKTEVRP